MRIIAKKTFFYGLATLLAAAFLTGCTPDGKTQVSASDTAEVSSSVEPARTVDTVTRSNVYDGGYRSELTENEQAVYDAMVRHYVVERKSNEERFTVDIVSFGVGQSGFRGYRATMRQAWEAFRLDYPEIFWVNYHSFDQQYDDNRQEIGISPRFDEWEGSYSEMETVFRGIDEAEAAIKEMRKSESRYDTVKAIHDYLCRTVDYDYDASELELSGNLEPHSVVPAFGGGSRPYKVVCEGYAKAFKALCNRFRIPSVLYNEYVHMWNLVQMDDGIWYGIDTTWDDVENGSPDYTYFLFGKNIPKIGDHHYFQDIAATYSAVYDEGQPDFYYPSPVAEKKYIPAK